MTLFAEKMAGKADSWRIKKSHQAPNRKPEVPRALRWFLTSQDRLLMNFQWTNEIQSALVAFTSVSSAQRDSQTWLASKSTEGRLISERVCRNKTCKLSQKIRREFLERGWIVTRRTVAAKSANIFRWLCRKKFDLAKILQETCARCRFRYRMIVTLWKEVAQTWQIWTNIWTSRQRPTPCTSWEV